MNNAFMRAEMYFLKSVTVYAMQASSRTLYT